MNQLKTLIFNRFNTFFLLTISIMISIFLLAIRVKLTHSFFLIFLVWNLFLAFIPYAISTYLESVKQPSKLNLLLTTATWLLFLPNAPYIVTDFIHLELNGNIMVWLDFLIISSFAFTGMALYYLSIMDMINIFMKYLNTMQLNFWLGVLFVLSAFGIYLGRFLRYNSWEIVQNPCMLFQDIFSIIIFPMHHFKAWVFILCFKIFLILCYNLFKKIIYSKVK